MIEPSRWWKRIVAALDAECSTRTMGLLRILLALICWAEWGNEMVPHGDHLTADRLWLSAVFFASTTWMLVGWYGRVGTAAAATVVITMVYVYGRMYGVEAWAHHHTTLLANSVALLALTPCSTSFSVDRWLAVRRAERAGHEPPPECGPSWAIALIGLQVSTLYFWSAVDKTTVPFLTGARLEQILLEVYFSSDTVVPDAVRPVLAAGAIAVVFVEYVLPFALFFRATQWLAIPVGMVLHAVFYLSLPVSTFSATMVALYLAYLDPDDFHAAFDKWLGSRPLAPRGGP